MKILTPGHRYQLANHEKTASVAEAPFPGSTADACYKLNLEIQQLPASGMQTVASLACSELHGRLLYEEQTLQFIEKVSAGNGVFETVHNGTTNEEVLRVLIDRLNTMQAKLPCRENAIVVTHLETALLWLEKRTRERQARGVEGTPKP